VTTTASQFAGLHSSTRLGLNAKAGAVYFFTRHVTAFTEVKYNYTRFDFPSNDNGGFGFKATYSPLIPAVGLTYHFYPYFLRASALPVFTLVSFH
jgi:opacity protein-like surface antigen